MGFFLLLRLLIFEPQLERRVEDALITANAATLGQLSETLVAPLLQRKFAAVHALLDAQLERQSWQRIRLSDAQDRQLYPLEDWAPSPLSHQTELRETIAVDGDVIGYVQLIVDFSPQISELRQSAYIQESVQALIIALGLLFMFFYHRRHIEHPLDELAKAMGELTLNNFTYPLPNAKFAEIAELETVFERSRHDVELYQQHLLEMKREADRANTAKSDFLSNMSHELRTPLNAIIGFTDLLKFDRDKRLGPTEQTYVQNIRVAGDALLGLISQLLDLAQIETGNYELDITDVSLTTLFEQAIDLVRPVADRRGVLIRYNPGAVATSVLVADFMRTRQVLLNLLSNAIKYNRDDGAGWVDVSFLETAPDRLRVVVEDNGIGISEDDLPRLFRRFERLKAVNSGIEGTGIGLFLCKQLIEAMDGDMGVESRPAEGSRFWFELPAKALPADSFQAASGTLNPFAAHRTPESVSSLESSSTPVSVPTTAERTVVSDTAESEGTTAHRTVAERVADAAPSEDHPPEDHPPEDHQPEDHQPSSHSDLGAGKRLLYIDDSRVNLAMIEALIKAHTAFDIVTEEVPQIGLRLAKEQSPDVILLDLQMPEMDGFEVVKQLRADGRTYDIPVIAYTANLMNTSAEATAEAGFNDFLTKPVTVDTLLKTLARHL